MGILDAGNYLIIYLLNGTIQVSIVSNDENKDEDINIALDWNNHINDNRWHRIIMKSTRKSIDIILDQVEESIDAKIVRVKEAYYGASPTFVDNTKMTQNYTGCLRNYYFNTFNPLSKVVQKSHKTIKNGCHIEQNSVKFIDKDSSLSYGNNVWIDDLKIVFDIRTYSENGLIFYNQFLWGFDQGFIQVMEFHFL